MSAQTSDAVRVRFAPSPTGYLHIGGARTVLFNWLLARQTGGTFILRIEDTDQTRNVEDSVQKILDDLRWLGLNWDEGPQVDGPYGPYFQSRRLDLYHRYAQQLLEAGRAYYAWETPQELAGMREQAVREKRTRMYERPDPLPTLAQGQAAKAAGKPVVVRLRMPAEDIVVTDDILGEVRQAADQHEDFVILKSDGFPTYHFAVVVDDELMKITHVLRGQEHLMNTPKHIALQRALGFATPRYAHLPVIINMDGTKMSKRDKEKALKAGLRPPEIDVHDFRSSGYLPEAVLNFLALLGWNPGDEREFFTLPELTAAFSVQRVGKTNARFDREKLLSFNTTWAGKVSPPRLLEAFRDFLAVNAREAGSSQEATGAGRHEGTGAQRQEGAEADRPGGQGIHAAMAAADDAVLTRILSLCVGFRTFAQVVDKAGLFFVPDDGVVYDPQAVRKVLAKNEGAGFAMLEHLLPRLETLRPWSAEAVDGLLKRVVEERGVKLGDVAQPLRVAVAGGTISPAIHETLDVLGQAATVARVRRCLQTARAVV